MSPKRVLRVVLGLLSLLLLAGLLYLAYYQGDRYLARRGYAERVATQAPRLEHTTDGHRVRVRNPVVATAADPWITAIDSNFLYVYSDHDRIIGKISPNIYDWDERQPTWTWQSDSIVDYWAPELHWIGGRWVIYFAANHGEPLPQGAHRTYALQAINNDPRQGVELHGRVPLQPDLLAIDATPLELRGKLYLIYSGNEPDGWLHQKLYVQEMQDPFTPVGQRVRIAEPTHEWELRGRRLGLWPTINEGPQVLQHDGRTFVVYSASGSWSDYYSLGLLELVGDDPLDPTAWRKDPEPVLASANDVLGPGHAGFVRYRGRDFIAFHAAKYRKAGWEREMHLQPFTYGEDGKPFFDKPLGREVVAWEDTLSGY